MEGKAYVGTGEHKGKTFGDFYTFEPEKGWSTFTSLGSSFMGGTAFVAEGNAYVCLGGSPSGIYPSLNYYLFIGMYKLSPGSSVWEQSLPMDGERGSLDCRRVFASSFVLSRDGADYVYVVSGVNEKGEPLTSCRGFNPRKEEWEEIPSIPEPAVKGIAFVIDGEGYVATNRGVQRSGSFWIFQPKY